ncbi:MAG: DUF6265 family protein [Gemmatimonadales bacterium]
MLNSSLIPTLLAAAVVTAPVAAQQPTPTPPPAPAPAPQDKKPDARPAVNLEKLKFMSGCWAGRLDKETIVEEIWTEPAENMLLATTRYVKKDIATGYEFTRIMATDSGVVFAAQGNGKPEDVYLMKQLADEYVLFENPAKTFPQRIMYRLASDGSLIPRNEGDAPSIELRMRKIKCPGAK